MASAAHITRACGKAISPFFTTETRYKEKEMQRPATRSMVFDMSRENVAVGIKINGASTIVINTTMYATLSSEYVRVFMYPFYG
jgi:hypothetical protein